MTGLFHGEQLWKALREADLPPLLPAIAYLTGDNSVLEKELRPSVNSTPLGLEPQGGLSPAAQDRARQRVFDALKTWDTAGRPAPVMPTKEALRPLLEFITGPVDDESVDLHVAQLGFEPESSQWTAPQTPIARDFTAVIIGAGMSGLAAAYRLAQAGVSFVIVERHDDVGGVWLENSYPGCQLDTSNFSYSYSFAQQSSWQYQYSRRDSILDYFQRFATDQSLREHIRFGCEVSGANYDEEASMWRVTVDNAAGVAETLVANVLISAVGQLNTPSYPVVPGVDSFAGPSWHTARWNHDVDLTGKRVGIVGSGASAFQVAPEIVDATAHLDLFQRTPPWIMPTPTYHSLIKPGLRWLFDQIPDYHRWFRFYQFWVSVEGRRRYAVVQPEWSESGSISAANSALREGLTEYLEKEFGDRPDLLAKVVPTYPPYAKRMLRDEGRWAATLKRDDVEIVTSAITEIVPSGIATADGSVHELDVIVYGTGFSASEFLVPMEIVGRGGVRLHDRWNGEARANVGITVPEFPNLFLLYGPNTNLVVNGSIVLFTEAEVDYVMACIKTLIETESAAMECKPEALETFYERVDAASAQMAFGVPGVTSWYKSASGRVSQNWPLSTLEFWRRTRQPEVDDYIFDKRVADAPTDLR